MTVQRKKQKFIICRIAAVLFIVFSASVFAYAGLHPVEDFSLHYNRAGMFLRGWRTERDSADGGFISKSVVVPAGETMIIYHDMPEVSTAREGVAILDPCMRMQVFLNGMLIESFGDRSDDVIGQEIGKSWFIVRIPRGYPDAILSLKMTNPTQSDITFYVTYTLFGQTNDLNNQIYINNIPALLLSLVFLVLGSILVIFSFVLRRYQIEELHAAVMNLSVLTVLSGVWFFTDSNLLQFLTGSVALRYSASFFLFLLIPLFGLAFFREYLKKGKRLIRGMWCGYLALMAFTVALYASGVVHISDGIIGIRVLSYVCTLVIFVLQVLEFIRTGSRYLLASLSGMLIMLLFALETLKRYYLQASSDDAFPFRIGFAIFLLVLTLTVLMRSFREIRGEMTLRRLKELAYVDPVTEGNSLAYLGEMFQRLSRDERNNYWIIYMNLVGFKAVNEIIGWERGNELLKALYAKNEEYLTEEEGEAQGALGQSSFVLLIRSDSRAIEVRKRCRDLKKGLSDLLREQFPSIALQAEFSACPVSAGQGMEFKAILDLARIAYRNITAAYDISSDCWLYTEICKDKLREEKSMENRLAQALKDHEMELFLQPKVDPSTGLVNGAEALVRWKREDGSILAPVYFIPVFERNGMIASVDLFMFRESCIFLKKWVEEGNRPFKLSVNISKYSILNPQNFRVYLKIIEEIQPPMQWLEFELTESMAYNNEEDIADLIDKIHEIGATVSMDDFGSSYSNLSAIQRLQFDTVKIDRGIFTHGFPNNEKDYQMVSAIMHMFTTIGIFVVAEGIDREDQVKALVKLGCHSIQGYYYSMPLSVSDFTKFFNKNGKNRES